MTTENAIKKIQKAGLGLKIEGSKFIAFGTKRKIEFYAQNDGTISTPYVLRFGQSDDSMTDSFPGSFFKTLSKAIERTSIA